MHIITYFCDILTEEKFCVNTSIKNATDMKSPYRAWYNVKLSLSHLLVWGCAIYIYVLYPKKSECLSEQHHPYLPSTLNGPYINGQSLNNHILKQKI